MSSSSVFSHSYYGIDQSTSALQDQRVELWLSSSVSCLSPQTSLADDRYLLPICRFPPAILDLHGHRYPLYAPISGFEALLINSCRICWVDQYNRHVLSGTYRSWYLWSILLNRLDHTSSRRWDLVQEGKLNWS